jgi:hypothetical protein
MKEPDEITKKLLSVLDLNTLDYIRSCLPIANNLRKLNEWLNYLIENHSDNPLVFLADDENFYHGNFNLSQRSELLGSESNNTK